MEQGRNRSPNPNFLVRISSGGVGVFHVKGCGPKCLVCPSKPMETKLFGGRPRDFLTGYPGGTRKFPKIIRFSSPSFSGLQKGPAERSHVKKRQKVSKSFSTLFDNFCAGQKSQKSSKSVKKFFDTFRQFSRGTIFPAPFGGL